MGAVRHAACVSLSWLLCGCGVIATPGSGDEGLPDARLGPFRVLGEDEVALPPMVLLDFTAQLGGAEVAGEEMYVHSAPEDDPVTVLRRATLDTPTKLSALETVLEPEAGQSGLRDPSVLVTGAGETLLYYGVGSGEWIGVARRQGGTFVADDARVLEAEDAVRTPIGAPSVVIFDGVWLLYYAVGDSIALATSTDGNSFAPQGVVLGPGNGWDGAAVGDPEAVVYVSPLGVESVRLYYTGVSDADPPERGVGVAASFDGRGFSRFVGNPIVAMDGDEWAPTIAPREGDEPSLLYFTRTSGTGRDAIAGAVYPGTATFAAE